MLLSCQLALSAASRRYLSDCLGKNAGLSSDAHYLCFWRAFGQEA